MNVLELYANSLIHFSKSKEIKLDESIVNINITLVDRRFIKASLEEIKLILPYCRVKILDDYWIAIYSSYFLNHKNLFNEFLERDIIVDSFKFLEIVGG